MSRARPSAGWADDPEESSGLLDGRQRAAFPAGRGAPFYKRAVRVVLPFPLFVLAVLAAGVFFHVADPYIWGAAGMSETTALALNALDLQQIKQNLKDCHSLHHQNDRMTEMIDRLNTEVVRLEKQCSGRKP